MYETLMQVLNKYPNAGLCCSDPSYFEELSEKTWDVKMYLSESTTYFSPEDVVSLGRVKGFSPDNVSHASIIRKEALSSFQFNVQELQTIVHHQLPVKLFIFNNQGYLSIRHTQEGFLNKHFLGSSAVGGISIPSITAVAHAYGFPTRTITEESRLTDVIQDVLSTRGPVLCEISISPTQEITPKIGFDQIAEGKFVARRLEDMWPYLQPEDLAQILHT